MFYAWTFLFLSLALHMALYLGTPDAPSPHPQGGIEMVDFDPQKLKHQKHARQIVHQQLPKLNDLKPKNPKYLGETDQTVDKQTKAKNSGIEREVQKKIGSRSNDQNSDAESEDGVGSRRRKTQNGDLGKKLFEITPTNSNDLPEVDEGLVTVLSTERFMYYSFYSRLMESFYPRWNMLVHQAVSRMSKQELRKISGHSNKTYLEVITDAEGFVENVLVTKTSGNDSVDAAAQQAFIQCKQFPNPPKAMIKEDGKVHLLFATNLDMNEDSPFRFQ